MIAEKTTFNFGTFDSGERLLHFGLLFISHDRDQIDKVLSFGVRIFSCKTRGVLLLTKFRAANVIVLHVLFCNYCKILPVYLLLNLYIVRFLI